jgi:hypothetical protein
MINSKLFGGIYFMHNNHLNAEVSRNEFINSPGPWIGINDAGSFLIIHNDIIMPIDSSYAGIEVWELSEIKSDIVISNNKIQSENSLFWGPIWMLGVNDAVITNNKITGSGPTTMYVGLDFLGGGVTGLMIKGNNVENWQVSDYYGFQGWFPGIAPIWLGWFTSNCIVVGHTKHNVADSGTNNIFVGVDKIQGPVIGEEVKEAMETKKDLMNL